MSNVEGEVEKLVVVVALGNAWFCRRRNDWTRVGVEVNAEHCLDESGESEPIIDFISYTNS
jgi:hypothetical protein